MRNNSEKCNILKTDGIMNCFKGKTITLNDPLLTIKLRTQFLYFTCRASTLRNGSSIKIRNAKKLMGDSLLSNFGQSSRTK